MPEILNLPQWPDREPNAYKNKFGRVLLIGGSVGMSGAAIMSACSALRSGAGLVMAAVPEDVWPIVAAANPCYMTIPLACEDGKIANKSIYQLEEELTKADIVGFGPGMGISSGVKEALRWLLGKKLKLVIDADGLNNLAKIKDWPSIVSGEVIITPHPGEMERLWKGLFRTKMPQDRVDIACEFSKASNSVVVLKGAHTVVASGDEYYVNKTGNPGMATAGSGDVLTGIVSAIWGQMLFWPAEAEGKSKAFQAASAGVHLHGIAGDLAAKKYTQEAMIAIDMIDLLGEAITEYKRS